MRFAISRRKDHGERTARPDRVTDRRRSRQGHHNDAEADGETDEGTDRADIMMLREIERQKKEQTGPK